MIRILLVDDHHAFCEALATVLSQEPDIEVVGQAGSIAEVRRLLETETAIDVGLVDLGLPDGDGSSVVELLRTRFHRSRVLVLTAVEDPIRSAQAVQAGAAGLLKKSSRVHEIVEAVRRVVVQQYLMSPAEIIDLLQTAERRRREENQNHRIVAQLTTREREVLASLALGFSDKDIAEHLKIRPDTVRTHMVNILAKLGVGSRLEALIFAIRHGVVNIADTDGPARLLD